ncbi:MAG: hypothetical protein CM1200mP18_22530 [Gammaproteobacteria bacterium]|nr:MAG: hypothetical protein CM1200mP18_22530 [Gammaproteobacteria bacterium]
MPRYFEVSQKYLTTSIWFWSRGLVPQILGPNGAGKTTLLKLLTRELYPVQREVRTSHSGAGRGDSGPCAHSWALFRVTSNTSMPVGQAGLRWSVGFFRQCWVWGHQEYEGSPKGVGPGDTA